MTPRLQPHRRGAPGIRLAELKPKGSAKLSGPGGGGGKAPSKAAAKGAGATKPSGTEQAPASGGAGGGARERLRDSGPNAHGGDAKATHQAHAKATA